MPPGPQDWGKVIPLSGTQGSRFIGIAIVQQRPFRLCKNCSQGIITLEDVPAYITYDAATGEPVYSDLFLQDLQYWDDMLTELIDPLVAEGYLQWTSLPEMGELYLEWEGECATP